jgi:hypothetical protein
MFVSLGDARALEHPGRPLCETALARLRNIAAILLHDAESRTITGATDFGHSLSISSGPAFRGQPEADDCHYTSISTVFSVTLYIQSRYNGREIGREKSGPERVHRLRREAKTPHEAILREVSERP